VGTRAGQYHHPNGSLNCLNSTQPSDVEAVEKIGTSEILVGGDSDEQRLTGELPTRFRCENGI
jgi:hypothetical protein